MIGSMRRSLPAWLRTAATSGGERLPLTGHSNWVSGVAFSPDGTRLATSMDSTARVWDVASGKLLASLTGHSEGVSGVAFSPDGTRLASSGDKTAIIWPMPPLPLALCNRIRNATRYQEVAEICETYEPL
jgi:WD40 repeat protein